MKVLLFAVAREATGGRGEIDRPLRGGADLSLAELLQELGDAYPELRRVLAHARVAVNGTYLGTGSGTGRRRLEDRDEVAILPPYSGG